MESVIEIIRDSDCIVGLDGLGGLDLRLKVLLEAILLFGIDWLELRVDGLVSMKDLLGVGIGGFFTSKVVKRVVGVFKRLRAGGLVVVIQEVVIFGGFFHGVGINDKKLNDKY